MTIAWLLDVDGVINVHRPTWNRELTQAKAGRLNVAYNQRLIDFIKEVILPMDVGIVWCTTWNYYPNELYGLEELLGINGQRGFGYTQQPEYMTCADQKVQAVRDVYAHVEQVIWTDDEEVSAALKLFPDLQDLKDVGTLLTVQPKSVDGLTPGHMGYIHDWIQKVKR